MIVPAGPDDGARTVPKGASIGPDGFATILAAPPSSYEPPPPPDPLVPSIGSPPGAPAVEAELAHLIRVLPRVFPQPPREEPMLTTLESPPMTEATVILRGGCFRLSTPGEPLVLLPVGTRAFLDRQGYLALGPADAPQSLSGRVGEVLRWEGVMRLVSDPAIVAPITRSCGASKVVQIGRTVSKAAQVSVEDAVTARNMSNMYGTPYAEARAEVAECRVNHDRRWAELRERYGDQPPPVELLPGPCMMVPPAPVMSPADCPEGTSLSGGLCRDGEGHVRPLPPRRKLG